MRFGFLSLGSCEIFESVKNLIVFRTVRLESDLMSSPIIPKTCADYFVVCDGSYLTVPPHQYLKYLINSSTFQQLFRVICHQLPAEIKQEK